MGQTIRAINQTQHGMTLRQVPDRHEQPQPSATFRPAGGRLWLVATILAVVQARLGRHIAPLIQLWNDYAIGNLDTVGREQPAAASRTIAAPPNTQPRSGLAGPEPPAKPRSDRTPPEKLPRAKGWLGMLCRHTVVAAVERCVNQPEMQAFVLAVPRAARHLRPICTVLQIPVPLYLKLRRTQPASTPQAEPPADASPDATEAPAPAPASPPAIRKLVPDPRHAHPGWRNYVTVSGRLRA
jgi:hypothetical protein